VGSTAPSMGPMSQTARWHSTFPSPHQRLRHQVIDGLIAPLMIDHGIGVIAHGTGVIDHTVSDYASASADAG
jgi:hypothetical protein